MPLSLLQARSANHRVEPVFLSDPYFRRGRDGTRYVYGQTEAGRYLFVVYLDLGGGIVRVISARDMKPRERRLYLQR
ncbi:BrnT family toxin [Candidatus Poribacteria bacterium]|nr:BrnT family toxin [Candidatus Poribacteria bacterium]